jgi:hypothetical protein
MKARTLVPAVALGGVVVGLAVGVRVFLRPETGHGDAERTLPDDEWAGAQDWFAAARNAASLPAATTATGPREVGLCRIAPGAASRCVSGVGATWAEAVVHAASGNDWLADGTLRLELVLEVAPSTFPADASPHQAGTRGLRVGPRTVWPSEVLIDGLFSTPDEDDPPVWKIPALQQALGVSSDTFAYESVTTFTLVQAAPGQPPRPVYRLHGRDWPATDPASLARPLHLAADHLVHLVSPEGRIRYRYDPRAGRALAGQNLLRHAGTTWSLLRANERFGDPRFVGAADRALSFLLRHTGTDVRQGPHGGGRVRFVLEGSNHKLGGAGLSLLALATWQQQTGDTKYEEAAKQFATHLLSQQQESGEFWSYAPKVEGGPRKPDRSEYYPGEAVLGLVAWYASDPDPRWLDTAKRGADWLIDVRDAGKGPGKLAADHWLMMALERLHRVTGDDRYVEHAIRLAETVAFQQQRQAGHDRFHPDYRGGFYEPPRSTPATIRAEGLGAVLDLCARTNRDCERFVPVLHLAVGHALQSQYGEDDTWWTPRPEDVVGGFAGGLVDPELRNDYTQHAFCALLAAERHPLRD